MKPCPNCGSKNVIGPMATDYTNPKHPGRTFRCQGCWHELTVHTPDTGRDIAETLHARELSAKVQWGNASARDMKAI